MDRVGEWGGGEAETALRNHLVLLPDLFPCTSGSCRVQGGGDQAIHAGIPDVRHPVNLMVINVMWRVRPSHGSTRTGKRMITTPTLAMNVIKVCCSHAIRCCAGGCYWCRTAAGCMQSCRSLLQKKTNPHGECQPAGVKGQLGPPV